MKGPKSFLIAAVALSSTASAWPGWLPAIDSLVVRADESTTTTAKETGTTTSASDTAEETGTTSTKSGAKVTTTNLNTGGITKTTATGTGTDSGTGTATGTNTDDDTTATTHTTFDAEDPAGGVSMITPVTTSGTALYRIGETITWAWNYTSLQATPTGIDVLVSCSAVTETWTLTQNMSYDATATFTWDTNAYAQTAVASPLLTEEYTLVIYDADSSVSATSEAGYLGVYNSFTFGLYNSRPYKDLGEWKCVTCSGAAGNNLDNQALRFAVGMATITVLTFTWFVAGLGAL